MKISIIIPVYNEEKTILKVLQELSNIKFKNFIKEVIVINDGSTDRTKEILDLIRIYLTKSILTWRIKEKVQL